MPARRDSRVGAESGSGVSRMVIWPTVGLGVGVAVETGGVSVGVAIEDGLAAGVDAVTVDLSVEVADEVGSNPIYTVTVK